MNDEILAEKIAKLALRVGQDVTEATAKRLTEPQARRAIGGLR